MNYIERINDIDIDVKIMITSCLILILCGVLPSVLNCNWLWFSRSGSLLVVFGIYIAWRDYKGEIDSALSVVKDVLKQKHKKNIENINKDEKGIINTEVKKGAANRTFDDNIKKIEDIQDVNKKTYDKIEFIVICIGTIVWGYGGLLNKLYC